MHALSVQKLKKVYETSRPFVAVDDISFHLDEGEILGLLGPNGSGKTTTIQMLLGTLTSTSGSICYFGKNFALFHDEILQQVSFASTYTSMPWLLTVKENLDICGYLYGLDPKESKKRFDPLLERFGILDKKKEKVSALSAGQVTRLMLVKAFFIKPKIVLLDEPTASLDPDIAQDICTFLLEERQKSGVSILFTSHKMDEVMQICDRAIFLQRGKLIADDRPKRLAERISRSLLRLEIVDGLNHALQLAKASNYNYTQKHTTVELMMDEEQIPQFLQAITSRGVSYSSIKIEEPSLDDFFVYVAKGAR